MTNHSSNTVELTREQKEALVKRLREFDSLVEDVRALHPSMENIPLQKVITFLREVDLNVRVEDLTGEVSDLCANPSQEGIDAVGNVLTYQYKQLGGHSENSSSVKVAKKTISDYVSTMIRVSPGKVPFFVVENAAAKKICITRADNFLYDSRTYLPWSRLCRSEGAQVYAVS